jgi:hypothetical protein
LTVPLNQRFNIDLARGRCWRYRFLWRSRRQGRQWLARWGRGRHAAGTLQCIGEVVILAAVGLRHAIDVIHALGRRWRRNINRRRRNWGDRRRSGQLIIALVIAERHLRRRLLWSRRNRRRRSIAKRWQGR